MKLNNYVNFEGQAEEAVLFYAKALKTEQPRILRYGDMKPSEEHPIPDEAKNYVMHTEINIGESIIRISDVLPHLPLTKGDNVQLNIDFDTEEEFDSVYSVLEEGATIIVPVSATFFAKKYVFFTDKYGVLWHLIVPSKH